RVSASPRVALYTTKSPNRSKRTTADKRTKSRLRNHRRSISEAAYPILAARTRHTRGPLHGDGSHQGDGFPIALEHHFGAAFVDFQVLGDDRDQIFLERFQCLGRERRPVLNQHEPEAFLRHMLTLILAPKEPREKIPHARPLLRLPVALRRRAPSYGQTRQSCAGGLPSRHPRAARRAPLRPRCGVRCCGKPGPPWCGR